MAQASSCSLLVVWQALQDHKINAYHYHYTVGGKVSGMYSTCMYWYL